MYCSFYRWLLRSKAQLSSTNLQIFVIDDKYILIIDVFDDLHSCGNIAEICSALELCPYFPFAGLLNMREAYAVPWV